MDSNTQDFQLPLPGFDTERRKYTFYAIVNTITGKRYVGVTTYAKNREIEHFSTLAKNKHHSQKLQKSYNKHGEKAFVWNVLERGLYTMMDAYAREEYWIAHFDSHKNGYNMNEGGYGTITPSIPCEWNSIQYPSITEAAKALGIEPSSMAYRVAMGYANDSDLNRMPTIWNGIEYPSISEAARAIGVSFKAMHRRVMEYGYTSDDDMKGHDKPIVWDGIEYPSATIAAEILGIDRRVLYSRLYAGWASDDDMKRQTSGIPCIWNGVQYKNLSECAKALGINQSTITRRIAKGYTSDSDLKKD